MTLPSKPENQISTTVLKPRNCAHWVDQLQKLFPQTSVPVTVEFAKAMGEIMGLYSEKVIASVCSPIDGLCTKIEYLPSLAKLKSSLEEAASEISERERLASQPRPQPAPRQKPDKSYLYTGPIEKIKPGDILSYRRLRE